MIKFKNGNMVRALVDISENNMRQLKETESKLIDAIIKAQGDEPNQYTRKQITKGQQAKDLSYKLNYKGRFLGRVRIKVKGGDYNVSFKYQ